MRFADQALQSAIDTGESRFVDVSPNSNRSCANRNAKGFGQFHYWSFIPVWCLFSPTATLSDRLSCSHLPARYTSKQTECTSDQSAVHPFRSPEENRKVDRLVLQKAYKGHSMSLILLLAQDVEHVLWQARFADHTTQNKTLKETKHVADGASRANAPHPAETASEASLSQRGTKAEPNSHRNLSQKHCPPQQKTQTTDTPPSSKHQPPPPHQANNKPDPGTKATTRLRKY